MQWQRDGVRRNAGIGESAQNVLRDARPAEIAQKVFRKHPRHIGQPRMRVGADRRAHVMENVRLAASRKTGMCFVHEVSMAGGDTWLN